MANSHNPSVRIRMYRQGLGDCFLLTFKEDQKDEFNMLIDCGLLQGTKNGTAIMLQVVEDIENTLTKKTDDGKKWLDVVVLTHEHADHISGFTQAREVFDRISFGEVWAAWMDDETHPSYDLVRKRFHKQVAGLQAALAQMDGDAQTGLKETVELLLHEFFDEGLLGANGQKPKRSSSWEYALSKSTNQAKFFKPGTMFTLPGFNDIRIYILGPSEDFESFTKVNPPEDDTYRSEGHGFALMDSFFAAVGSDDGDPLSMESFQPFEPRLRIAAADAEKDDFFKAHYGFGPSVTDSWRQINNDWLSVAGGLALNLDSYTNNTCLAFAIEFISSRKVMLFPGDAQFSNWLSWQKVTWEVPDQQGAKQKVTAKDLLERTVFYKVGHHGSHNATLKKNGLEMMNSPNLMAMIPVDREQAKSKTSKTNPKGWEMPEKFLYDRLLQRTRGRVVLADESGLNDLKTRCSDQSFIGKVTFGGSLRRTDTAGAAMEPLYIDLMIDG
ncbi:MAG TPA: MBL fold metallo-hydrolase [Pyrinomonadaceae bacterium]|nr:MBL fold metallo-hydrolase [Pyrinomonadaceae bacterium]